MASPQVNTGTSLSDVTSSIYKPAMDSANKFDKDTDEGIKKMESEKVPTPPQLTESPKPENYKSDPMEAFGSPVMWLATFGSLLTKQPLETALNSGAAVFKARTQSGVQDFKQATEKWKNDTENAWKMANYQQDLYKDVLNKDESELRARAVSAKDNVMIHMADAKMQGQLQRDRDRNAEKLQKNLQSQNYAMSKMDEAKAAGKSPQEQQEAYFTALGDVKAMESGKPNAKGAPGADIDWAKADPKTVVPGAGMTVGAIKQAAEGILKTGSVTSAGLGYGWNPAKQAVDNYLAAVHPDFNRGEAGLAYKEEGKEVTSVATKIANVRFASNMLDKSIPSMLESAKKLGLDTSTDINSIYNYAEKHLSDKDFTNFAAQIRAVASDYAQFIGRGSGTVHSDEEALKVLNQNMGQTALEGFADAINVEKKNVEEASKTTKEETLNGGKSEDGSKPDGKRVKVSDPDGNPKTIDASELDEALQHGWEKR